MIINTDAPCRQQSGGVKKKDEAKGNGEPAEAATSADV